MKKALLFLALIIFFCSCGANKKLSVSKKNFKGDWTLNSISYGETGNFKVSLFDDSSKECFEGSLWQFVPNNNTGKYTISDPNCITGKRYFVFSIETIDKEKGQYDFMLKPTNDKYKSETNKGIRINVINLSESMMEWQHTVTLEGKPFTLTFNFNKI